MAVVGELVRHGANSYRAGTTCLRLSRDATYLGPHFKERQVRNELAGQAVTHGSTPW